MGGNPNRPLVFHRHPVGCPIYLYTHKRALLKCGYRNVNNAFAMPKVGSKVGPHHLSGNHQNLGSFHFLENPGGGKPETMLPGRRGNGEGGIRLGGFCGPSTCIPKLLFRRPENTSSIFAEEMLGTPWSFFSLLGLFRRHASVRFPGAHHTNFDCIAVDTRSNIFFLHDVWSDLASISRSCPLFHGRTSSSGVLHLGRCT